MEDFLVCLHQVLIHIKQGKEEGVPVRRPEDSDQLRKRKVLVIFRDNKRLNLILYGVLLE